MTEAELLELEELCGMATPGPWLIDGPCVYALNEHGSNRFSAGIGTGFVQQSRLKSERTSADEIEADAQLIAAARTAIPELIAEIRRLRDRQVCSNCHLFDDFCECSDDEKYGDA